MYGNNMYPYFGYQQRMQPYNVPNEMSNIPQMTRSGLQGKQVDSIEVVKAMDISLDGISYFPLIDGSAIITKQIQNDGTSKIVIFKPIEETKEENKYITREELKSMLNEFSIDDLEDIKEEIKDIKKQLKRKGE